MAIDVTTTITYEYHELTRWGYELKIDIPTVVTADRAFWAIGPELRSDRVLFGVSLNYKRSIPVAQPIGAEPIVAGAPGPVITYVTSGKNYTNQANADTAALLQRSEALNFLNEVSSLNGTVLAPKVAIYTYPLAIPS